MCNCFIIAVKGQNNDKCVMDVRENLPPVRQVVFQSRGLGMEGLVRWGMVSQRWDWYQPKKEDEKLVCFLRLQNLQDSGFLGPKVARVVPSLGNRWWPQFL